jgi:hypothetical protein
MRDSVALLVSFNENWPMLQFLRRAADEQREAARPTGWQNNTTKIAAVAAAAV